VLDAGSPAPGFALTLVDGAQVQLTVPAGATPGVHLLSLEDAQGKRSNWLPLTIGG